MFSSIFSPRLIVSLTTSPKRINNIHYTINSIMNQTIPPDFIIINLPIVFKRDNSKFKKIPDFLLTNPKVIINPVEDIGPATKIVPTCKNKFVKNSDIIFSIDDDIYYPPNVLQTYLYYHTYYPDCIITGTTLFYLNNTKYYPLKECELLEGFSCVLYKKWHLEDIPMYHFDKNKVPIYYYLADDLVLSNYLKSKNVVILCLNGAIKEIKPYDYGMKEDALHKGASGTTDTCNLGEHCNFTNYIKAIAWMKEKNMYYLKNDKLNRN